MYENKWINESEYNKRIKLIAKENEKELTNSYLHELLAPKANFKNPVGEICVVPVQTYIRLDEDRDGNGNGKSSEESYSVAMRIDHIFVKVPNQRNWRVLEFNRNILDLAFNRFSLQYEESE